MVSVIRHIQLSNMGSVPKWSEMWHSTVMALQQQGINLEDASLHPQVAALLKQAAASAGSSATSSMSPSPARATPLGETGNGNGFVAVELPSVSQTGDDEPDRAVVVLDVPQDDEPMEIGKEEKADDSKEQRAIATRTFKTGSWAYVCLHVCVYVRVFVVHVSPS